MPIDYQIDPDQQCVTVTGIGKQTMAEMIRVVDNIAEDSVFDSQYCVLFDLRQSDYTAELSDGADFVRAVKRRMPDFQNKFALIVPPHLHVLATLHSVLAASGGFDRMSCFLEIGGAMDWCGIEHKD